MKDSSREVLKITELTTEFRIPEGVVPAVNQLSFNLHAKETVCLVGESGCGKSVTALSIMRLIPDPPGRIAGGAIEFDGQNLLTLSGEEMRRIRGSQIAMIFQEPMTSLNPLFTVGDQIAEVYQEHTTQDRRSAWKSVEAILGRVGIPEPGQRSRQYIHEMSGGMRQRAMIAMALACNPSLLIADEPTTALDVTIQAQILSLMRELQDRSGAAILLITHNLGVVAEMCDRVGVMYAGSMAEIGSARTIFKQHLHPYTRGLMKSVPSIQGDVDKLYTIRGSVPNLIYPPSGCRFHPRCDFAKDYCTKVKPELIEKEPGHSASCHMVAGVREYAESGPIK